MAEEPEWIPAIQALALVRQLLNETNEGAASVLVRWAAMGLVDGRCRLVAHWNEDDGDLGLPDIEKDQPVTILFWHRFGALNLAQQSNWKSGEFQISIESMVDGTQSTSVAGVEFDAAQIREAAPVGPAAAVPDDIAAAANNPAPKNKGGAPRKAFWDLLWIEMIRRIRSGALNPSSAAELEGIMETWLEENGFSYGDGTLHKTALNLFKYLQES